MKFSTFLYSIKQGIHNIWRNKMFSLASIATMTACIFLFGLFFAIGTNFRSMVKNAEKGVAITVFFNEGVTQDQIDAVGKKIEARKEVSSYHFVSADEAWKTFKKEYFGNNTDAAAGFSNDNPLANCANYEIYMKDISKQATLVKYLQKLDGVRQVNQSQVAANTLSDFNRLITLISISVIIILVAVAIFLISNTITVGISVRREEIAIMKLIGAKDNFVRAPFVVEGITIGLIGSAIPLILLFFLYNRIIVYVENRFHFLSSMISFVSVGSIFHVLVPVSLVLGVGIGYIGSRFTLKKHLKV